MTIGHEDLDRASFVPLYYQLQELLKEQIESGVWKPGDALPSEPQLASQFGVSRIVVRQALAILSDDRQVIRERGRGTFVAPPKLDHRAGGLTRLLERPRPGDVTIQVLDLRIVAAERSIRRRLGVADSDRLLRCTTLLSVREIPLAISYSFFRDHEFGWLREVAHPGRNLPNGLVLADRGVTLGTSELSIETSQCGQFEADRFGIAHRAAVFLVLCTEHAPTSADGEMRPIEVARSEYRGDLVQFHLDLSSARDRPLDAVWQLTPPPNGAASRRRGGG